MTGPPKMVAYDAEGAPTRAAVSFAEKQGVPLHQLHTVQTAKGEFVAAKTIRRGRSSQDLLFEILPRVIHDISWPKTMTWTGLKGARFIRPIRWIVALLDGKPLKFSFGGVTAGNTTRGHRFLGKPSIEVKNFADYERKLRANGVIVRQQERLEKIERELAAHAKRGGYHGQWRAPIQTVRGVGMAKPVRRHLGRYVELGRDFFNDVVHGTSAQALRTIASAVRYEERGIARSPLTRGKDDCA